MNKLKKWFESHMGQTKTIFIVMIVVDFFVILQNLILEKKSSIWLSFAKLLGSIVGSILGIVILPLIVSLLLGGIAYLIFHGVAEKYKKYLDYVAVIFLILTLVIIFGTVINNSSY